MKIRSLFIISLCLISVAGCSTYSKVSKSYNLPSADQSPSANLLVISAVYGSGTHFADVTYRVDDLLHQPFVEFFARPEWLQADPTPGWNKALVIVYEFKGHRHVFTTGEGGKVNVDLLIEQAKKKPKRGGV
jgi:hypothetical protein